MALRVSVTTLEEFRLYLDPTIHWKPESELLATIKGEKVFTPKMRLGTSGHCALENREPDHVKDGWHKCYGFAWSPETVEAIRPHYPTGGVSEIKGERTFRIKGQDVTLSGKGDHFYGTKQTEAKFTLSPFNPEMYFASMQWRSYVLIYGAVSVEYVVFCCKLDEDTGEVTVSEVHPFALYPYPSLGQEVVDLLERFVDYVELRNLGRYLQPKAAA